jgi:hypothetical protein
VCHFVLSVALRFGFDLSFPASLWPAPPVPLRANWSLANMLEPLNMSVPPLETLLIGMRGSK